MDVYLSIVSKTLHVQTCGLNLRIALRMMAVAPDEAKTVPIGTKRKRGRPAKAKKALIIQ